MASSSMSGKVAVRFMLVAKTVDENETADVISDNVNYGSISNALDVRTYKEARIFSYVEGGTVSNAENVVLVFQVSAEGTDWYDLDDFTVAQSGTSIITDSTSHLAIDLKTINYIRLGRIINAETEAGRFVDVNASIDLH